MSMQSPSDNIPELPTQHQWYGEVGNSEYIPGWYLPHKDPEKIQVRGHDGEPLGFTVRNVLPWRRWAIQADGQVYPQHEFEDRLMQYYVGFQTDGSVHEKNEPVPQVVFYVSQTLDSNGQLVQIGFDPDVPAPVAPQAKHNTNGDVVPGWENGGTVSARLAEIDVLDKLLDKGVISESDYAKTIRGLGASAPEQLEVAEGKLSQLVDRDGRTFDPEVHEMDQHGEPVKNGDGTLRRRRGRPRKEE